jgi:hypothetical protein
MVLDVGQSSIQLRDTSFADAAGEVISPELRDSEVQVTEFPVYDANGDGVVNILDLVMIQEGEASPASASNALGNNYPNPFNPETWIPYSLANGGDVVISIYNSAGAVVRTLDLGYRQMGRYTTRSAAAYWDGTNEAGERVASGVYYYRISAGGFSAVRKMVVLE